MMNKNITKKTDSVKYMLAESKATNLLISLKKTRKLYQDALSSPEFIQGFNFGENKHAK